MTPILPVQRARFQPFCGGQKVFEHLAAVDGAEKLAAFVVVARITADRREAIRGEGDEVRDTEALRCLRYGD